MRRFAGPDRERQMRLARSVVIAVGLFGAAQLVPYGRSHENPPTVAEPKWDAQSTRELFFQVCRDCHSNETVWPWYSHIAPASWLLQYDVNEGRSHLNVSQWGRDKQHGDEAAEMLREGEMPPWYYLPLHAAARLDPDERSRFIEGLEQTFGEKAAPDGHGDGHSHDHKH